MLRGADASRRGRSGRRALLFVAALYAATSAWMPDGGFWINDNGLKFVQVDGLVRSGFSTLAIEWPGRALDPDLAFGPLTPGFAYEHDGALYAAYSPVFAIATAPLYAWLGLAGLYLLPLAGGILTLDAVRRIAAAVAPAATADRASAVAVLAGGLGTPLFFYAETFWEHAPAVAFACYGVLGCVRFRAERSTRRAVATGVAAALACWLRTDAYLLAAIVLGAAWWGGRHRLRDAAWLGGAFAATMAPVWLLHAIVFGDPLGPHVASQVAAVDPAAFVASRARAASNTLFRAHASAAWSAVAAAPFALALCARPLRIGERWPASVPVAAGAAAAAGVVVAAGHATAEHPMSWLLLSGGLFAASPLLVLALLHPVAARGGNAPPDEDAARARDAVFAIGCAYAVAFAVLAPEVNSRGIHWGNRFLLPVYPLFAALASAVAVAWWSRAGRGRPLGKAALCAVFAASIALQLHSLRLLHDRKAFTQALNDRVRASPLDTVVVDTWFLTVDLGRAFYDKAIFLVPGTDRDAFRTLARRGGIDRALSIERRRGGGVDPRDDGADTLDDGWLRFSRVALREVALGGPAVRRGEGS